MGPRKDGGWAPLNPEPDFEEMTKVAFYGRAGAGGVMRVPPTKQME